jgi:hypothetical protein
MKRRDFIKAVLSVPLAAPFLAQAGIPFREMVPKEAAIQLTPEQERFFQSEAFMTAFFGPAACGKTTVGILKAVQLSLKYPNNLGVIYRRYYIDLRDDTMRAFEQVTGMKVRKNKSVEFANGSKILFMHGDEIEGVVGNYNLGWFWMDDVRHFEDEQAFLRLRFRLRRGVPTRQGFVTDQQGGRERNLFRTIPDSEVIEL